MPTLLEIFARLNALAAQAFAGPGLMWLVRRYGSIFIALINLPTINRWLRRNKYNQNLIDELNDSSRILAPILRPYVHKNWTIQKRLEVVEQHYQALQGKGQLFIFSNKQYINLIQLGPEFLSLRVVVDKPGWMLNEGEFAVSLFYQIHRIYTATCLIMQDGEHRSLVIGTVQGWNNPDAKQVYVDITHHIFGLMPRKLLIHVVQIIAKNLGCASIYGVSDACHKSKHRLSHATGKINTIDQIWQEHSGQLNADGFYVFSSDIQQRDPAEIPSRKRAQYRRRYEFINQIQQQIQHTFDTGERVLMTHQHDN